MAWADNRLDAGEPDGASRRLNEAIDLLKTKGGGPEVLSRALQKRAAIAIDGGNSQKALGLLQQIEQISQTRPTPLERANVASTKAALLAQVGKSVDAALFYEEALADTREAAPEGSLEVGEGLINLAYAKGKIGDINRGLEGAQAADHALSAWLAEIGGLPRWHRREPAHRRPDTRKPRYVCNLEAAGLTATEWGK